MDTELVEKLVVEEWKPGTSAGAAARQIVSGLRCQDRISPLAGLLEALLSDANQDGHRIAQARQAVRWLLHAIGVRPCLTHNPSLEEAIENANKVLDRERASEPVH